MKGHLGINVNANATITMTAVQYLELQAETQKWSMQIEQQRIIKLLEVALDYSEIDCALFWEEEIEISKGRGTQVTKDELIALIKGEQK